MVRDDILERMFPDPLAAELGCVDQAWHEIDNLLDEIAQLSRSDAPAGTVYAQTLERLTRGLAATGAALWTRSASGIALACEINPPDAWPVEADRRQLIDLVLQTGKPQVLPPNCQRAEVGRMANPTPLLRIVCPWLVESVPAGAIEIFQRAETSAGTQSGQLRFLEAIGELLADYQRNCQLREFRDYVEEARRLDQFARRVHASLDLRGTAYAIVNEGRLLLRCDRVSVLLRRRRVCRLAAVSGVDWFNRRANVVRRLERLCESVATFAEPLWHPAATGDRPPQVEELLSDYLDESHARAVAVLPLKGAESESSSASRRGGGVLVAECFYGDFDARQRAVLADVCAHSELALRNARQWADLPLLGLLRKVRWLKAARRPWKIGLALLALAAAAIALAWVPADFEISARGELQPRRTRDVFALTDGLVGDLSVKHGQRVGANQLLAVLRRPQLDLEFKQIWGELQTARKRLASSEAERLQLSHEGEEQRRRSSQLTSQEEELREVVRSLEEQYAVLQLKQKEQEVRSPMAGEILTWNVSQVLEARPVSRGQVLMTVGDLAGPWQVELHVPDRSIAHVLAAARDSGEHLGVTYVLSTEPGLLLHGTIERVALRAEAAEGEEPGVTVVVDVDRNTIPKLIPGVTVSANIHCGRRSVGYVWLHDLIDAVRTRYLF
jgi:multidrug efflux pump subunit AcrA (membrane-fusion protein)